MWGNAEITGTGSFHNYGLFRKGDPMKSRAIGHVGVAFDNRSDDPGDGAIIVDDGVLWMEEEFTNSGSCFVNTAAEMLFDPGDGPFRGSDRAEGAARVPGLATTYAGGAWRIAGTVTVDSMARFVNHGRVALDSGSVLTNRGDFDLEENGILQGSGTFDNTLGTFTGGGVIRPGSSTGIFTFLGDFTQTPTAEFEVELGGTAPGAEYDRLVITGNAAFDGAMYVDLVNGFVPVVDDSFAVILLTGGVGPRTDFDCFSGFDASDSVFLEPVQEMDLFALVARDSVSGNTRPTAAADFDSTVSGTPIVIHPLGNDSDADLDPIRIATIRTGMTVGAVTIGVNDTTLLYTPAAGFIGRDSIGYTVTDCQGGVDSAWVTVGVARAPRSWRVPVDAPTIKAALDSAQAPDTVIVAPGMYHEGNIVMKSGVVLRGATGNPADVTVDADSLGRGISCSGLDAATAVIGITFTGGVQVNGGGCYVTGSDMTFERCVFTGNRATSYGGGVRVYGCDPVFRGCDFTGNEALSGGGLSVITSTAVLESCLVAGNAATNAGGGIHASGTTLSITQGTIAENECASTGAAMYVTSGTVTLERSIVAFNEGGVAILCSGTGFINLACSDVYGNSGGDFTGCLAGQEGVNGNWSSDPLFCLGNAPGDRYSIDGASDCAPAQQPTCGLVGARGVGCEVTGVAEETPPAPPAHKLYANRPNPFNPATTIRFDLPREERVTLFVYDVSGRRVATLADGRFGPGAFERVWRGVDESGRSAGSGVYFARLRAGDFAAVRKMVLLK
ncbi:MAG: Ig-like domain-containing protein [Candidatus Eisenbacteria bacterium]